MKIVFLCNEYPPFQKTGGIGIFTHTIAHALAQAGHEVTVLGYNKYHGERYDKSIKIVILPESDLRGLSWFINRARLYLRIRHWRKAGKIDLVESPEYLGLLPLGIKKLPIIIRLHSSGIHRRRTVRLLEKMTLKSNRNWIGVSNWIMEETQLKYNIRPKHSTIIYNPVKIIKASAQIPSLIPDNYVLYVGTISDAKGAYVLAESARKFLAEHPDLHLVYIGTSAERKGQSAETKIRSILGGGLASRAHFTGILEHATTLACMKKAKVFAFPSKLEAFSLVVIEAMSVGTPVIYSKSHTGPELIEDGVSGLLVDHCDSEDVANKVQEILRNPKLGEYLGKNAAIRVREKFSVDKCIKDTVAFYEKFLHNNP